MAFWSNVQTGEPLRQYRWYMQFAGLAAASAVKYSLKKVEKPKAKINEVTHKYLNHFYNYPGRLEWEPISLTIAATNEPSMDEALNLLLVQVGYIYPVNPDIIETISKNKSSTNLGEVSITQINSSGVEIEKWVLINPFFTSIQFGSLDYASEEIVEINCTLRYDSATLSSVAVTPKENG